MEQAFTFLFKYRPVAFARGALAFEPPGPWWLVALVGLGTAVAAGFFYWRAQHLALRDRLTLCALRAASLAIVVVCLAGPVLLVATAVPQRNVLAVLVDRSRSMGIADENGATRLAAALAAFAPGTGRVSSALGDRFQVRTFTYADALQPLATDTLSPGGLETDLARALDDVRERLAGQTVAGVVVVGDGGDASDRLTPALLAWRAAGVPVHAVALGAERLERDLRVEPVGLPARVLQGSAVVAEVRVAHRGYGGRDVSVAVEDDGAVVGQATARLPAGGDAVTVPVRFTLGEPGARRIRVRVPVLDGEQTAGNNAAEALVFVDPREARVLYLEGEPRFEVKFLRRAVADDEQLAVSVLLRTADEKYLRLDVADSTELLGGFPRTRTELFRYRGLLLGSVEASLFTRDQLRMIADFVQARGGGLLVLGGRRALGNGGYARTAVADALPVELPAADTGFFREVRVRPTPAGQRHAALRLDNERRWDSLPPLSLLHPVTALKPGAVSLLTGEAPGGSWTVLAAHRYGRGRAAVFNVQDSWQWQMHASVPLEDQGHETLWRQLLRWLVAESPDQVSVRAARAIAPPGQAVRLTAEVSDSAFAPLNGADVVATVREPDGTERSVPLAWSVETDGAYRGSFTPAAEGLYEVTVDARSEGRAVGSASTVVRAGDPGTEFSPAARQTDVLRRLADETGGGFYTAATAGRLVEDARFTAAGATTRERLDLWDMPIMLLVLLACLGAEWGYRRVRGLA